MSKAEESASGEHDFCTRRLIETWLPIAELSEESVRERRSMTALPPTYYLHVWWARRPLVASRAAVVASLLPADADRQKFLHLLGIHGDPVAAKARIAEAKKRSDAKTGKRESLGPNPYGYRRAFLYLPTADDLSFLASALGASTPRVLDPTAGGGSIPLETARVRMSALANDLNPVAWLVLKATVDLPARHGPTLARAFRDLGADFLRRAEPKLEKYFAREPDGKTVDAYLWARTIRCPYCSAVIPLNPNWRLTSKGTGIRLSGSTDGKRQIRFEIVHTVAEQSQGTIREGDALCPLQDCGRVVDGDEVKRQAQAGEMAERLYAVAVTERRPSGQTKAGKLRSARIRSFRVPEDRDEPGRFMEHFEEQLTEWRARGLVPSEEIDALSNYDRGHRMYGMRSWVHLYSPRQLAGMATAIDVYQELFRERYSSASEVERAAFVYLAIAIDKLANFNCRMTRWDVKRGAVVGKFDSHNYSMKWSYAEMAPAITSAGYRWCLGQTEKALNELLDLTRSRTGPRARSRQLSLIVDQAPVVTPPSSLTCRSADDLSHIETASVDAVVMDPPYYDNVMYAELSDFFYVWLKRTAGLLYPEQFADHLTDKDREAVANVAKFKDFSKVKGSGGAKRRAARDYQERMQAIFTEVRRVLKPDGIMTLMFTHKASGAWDALAKGLVEAGFMITASWPIQTEAEGSLHIKEKNAAKSTIFLVCRPRTAEAGEPTYWEEVEPQVVQVVRERVKEFQEAGIGGVDLYLACFGPALGVFSRNWPMIRGRAAQPPPPVKGAQLKLVEEEEFDPYAVRPEDALMAARAAVKDWRLGQIATLSRKAGLDPVTEWFVLAWDAFRSPQFPADEALKLARVVGLSFDEKLRGRILELKASDVVLWDSVTRARKGTLGSAGGGVLLDALHHAASIARERNLGAAREAIEHADLVKDPKWLLALQAVLEVLPPPRSLPSGAAGPIAGAAADAEALEKLRRLAFSAEVPTPKPWQQQFEGGSWTETS